MKDRLIYYNEFDYHPVAKHSFPHSSLDNSDKIHEITKYKNIILKMTPIKRFPSVKARTIQIVNIGAPEI